MNFKDIPKMTRQANYSVNVSWDYLQDCLERWTNQKKTAKLDMDPDFQRAHVWTREQQIAYVEFKLRGGSGSNVILFNCKRRMGVFSGPFVLVDGKQRIEAVLAFLRGDIPAFGHYFSEFEGRVPSNVDFVFQVNDLDTREQVLQWYLELNTSGTPHTKEEIEKVCRMLERVKENVE